MTQSSEKASTTGSTGETTLEELLQMIARLVANEPHARCRIGEGTLAPLAAALNRLATQLERRETDTSELFGVRALVEQSPNMMLACDTDSNIRFFNYTTPRCDLHRHAATQAVQPQVGVHGAITQTRHHLDGG
jgi:hypothetical protein